jgi:hypothetical protein
MVQMKFKIRLICSLFLLQFAIAVAHGDQDRKDSVLIDGKFGKAIDLSLARRTAQIDLADTMMGGFPLTFQCWAKFNDFKEFNIVMSVASKRTPFHWEIYTVREQNAIGLNMHQVGDFRSGPILEQDQWHFIALRIDVNSVQMLVDGREVVNQSTEKRIRFDSSPLLLGTVEDDPLICNGAIDELVITRHRGNLVGYIPKEACKPDKETLYLFPFDDYKDGITPNAVFAAPPFQGMVYDNLSFPRGERFLDEVQDERYAKNKIHGDKFIEYESSLPVVFTKAVVVKKGAVTCPPHVKSLDGCWRLKPSAHRMEAVLRDLRTDPQESEGTKQGWFRYGYDRSDWLEITVPTSVQNAMLEAGKLRNPFWDTNTWDELHLYGEPKDILWHYRQTRIERQDWWFAREFKLSDEWRNRKIRLSFDGIDIAGSFYLNGYSLGCHFGMFGGPEYDVTDLLYFDKPNELVVRIDRVPDLWPGILKGSPGWGWHYGHLISMGIWRSVELQEVPSIEIESPCVKTNSLKDKTAQLTIAYYLNSRQADLTEVELRGLIRPKTISGQPLYFRNKITVPFGKTCFETQITMKNPLLWWPMNYGDPHLYSLELSLFSAGKSVDKTDVDFGVRTIQMRPLRGARPQEHYRWQFVINNVPMFIKGANWCWTDPMLQQTPEKYEYFLELCRRANIQMLRSWGGGIIESDEFYRKCNEKGIMVYQELPFCWGPPDFPMTDPQVTDDQVVRVVKRLRNHPSLVMWGGGNENVAIQGNDEGLTLVGRRCRQYDSSRPFHRTSPWGGSVHNWGVFHHGWPIDSGLTRQPSVWYGEFGIPSMTNYNETLIYMPVEKLQYWPAAQDDGGWLMHMNQFSFGDMVKVLRYCDYGHVTDWKQYIEYSQMAQGDEIQFAGNFQRAGSYLNKGGLWFYKMSDLFPGQSWGVVGFYGHPKLSYYRAKQVYKPQAAFIHAAKFDWQDNEPFEAVVNVNNDTAVLLKKAVVDVILYGSDLRLLWSKTYRIDELEASSRHLLDILSIPLDATKTKPFLVAVSLKDSEGKQLSDQWNWFNFKAETEAVKKLEEMPVAVWPQEISRQAWDAYGQPSEDRLLNLPRTNLQAEISVNEKNGIITIENKGAIPVFNVIIDDFPYGYGNFLEDNSFCLYPGETRNISFQIEEGGKGLNQITLRAWNADMIKPRLSQDLLDFVITQTVPRKESDIRVPDRCVVMTFDDGTVSQLKAAAMLKKYGFGATFFISDMDFNFENDPKLRWEQIRQLHEDGFEIASHTDTHPDVRKLCREEFISELDGIEKKCWRQGIPQPINFAYPGYHESKEAAQMLQERGYRFARAGGCRAYDPKRDDPFAVPTCGNWGVPKNDRFPPPGDTMGYFIESVMRSRDGKVVVLTYHGIPEMDNAENSLFKSHLDYLRDNGYTVIAMKDLPDHARGR